MKTTPGNETLNPGVDVRDMVVVHTAMLREIRLAPAVVRLAQHGTARQRQAAVAHVDLLCDLLHHHHTGEDELLWPVLSPRLSPRELELVTVAESQHAGIEQALHRVAAARTAWSENTDDATADELVAGLEVLHGLLREHLEAEERHLLPLAAAYLTPAEWGAIGEAGAAGVPKSALLLVFGMFAYEGDPAVLAQMLHAAPPPVRLIVPRLAPRVYARYAARVHGTRTP